MKWYKKQLAEKLKQIEAAKPVSKKKKVEETKVVKNPARHSFDPKALTGKKNNFVSPVAARNKNRKKTDLPSA